MKSLQSYKAGRIKHSAGFKYLSGETIIFSLFLFCTFMLPQNIYAWSSGTHAYMANELSRDISDPLVIYGAIAPDFFNQEFDSPYYEYLYRITHYNLEKLKSEARKKKLNRFSFGYISHNEKWGADLTAHKKGITLSKGYALEKGGILASRIRPELEKLFSNAGVKYPSILAGTVSSAIAHPLIETAVDLQIKANEDPLIGNKILSSALYVSDEASEILASAYARSFSKKYRISLAEASGIIRDIELKFRESMVLYGQILMQDEETAIRQLSEEGAALVNKFLPSDIPAGARISSEIMKIFLEFAVEEVCADYAAEISATINYLNKRSGIKNLYRTILKEKRF